jgi:tRNA(Met) C34 N-acetyltransferase TmcA
LPQANNNNGVKTIIIITRIEEQQEAWTKKVQTPLNFKWQSWVHWWSRTVTSQHAQEKEKNMHKMRNSNYYLALGEDLIQLRTRGHVNASACTMHTQTTIIYALMRWCVPTYAHTTWS